MRRDFFKQRFSIDELTELLCELGLRPEQVLSRRSTAFRQRPDEIAGMADDDLVAAMVAEPTLLRRPLLVADAGYGVGYDAKRYKELTEAG